MPLYKKHLIDIITYIYIFYYRFLEIYKCQKVLLKTSILKTLILTNLI